MLKLPGSCQQLQVEIKLIKNLRKLLWLGILRNCGYEKIGKKTTSGEAAFGGLGGVPPKGGVGENLFPPSERLLRKDKSKR